MAGNNLLTSQVIVKRGLAKLAEDPRILGLVNRQYDTQFGYKGGARFGDTISVRVPQHAQIRKGRIMDVMPIVNKTIPVKVDQYYGVDTAATSAEMAMQIEDFADEFIDPFIPDLVANVEADFINKVTPLVPSAVGDYGAFDDAKTALQAKAYLDSMLAPKNDRNLLVNTYSQVDIVDSLKGLYNSQSKIDRQYRKGDMATDTLGFDWYASNLTATTTRGTGAGYLVNGASQSGSTLVVDTGTGTINPGDSFTIAGVYAVHPQTKRPLPSLQQFTVTSVHSGGGGTLQITPEMVTSGTEQNVSAAPADNAAITIRGTAGTSYAQNLAFSKDAFYFVTADLPNPPASHGVDAASATWKGVTLRFIQGFDMVNDQWMSRFDLCWGGGILRPELAVRIPATVTGF